MNIPSQQMMMPQQQPHQDYLSQMMQALIPFGMMAFGVPPEMAGLAGTLLGGKGGLGNIFNPMGGFIQQMSKGDPGMGGGGGAPGGYSGGMPNTPGPGQGLNFPMYPNQQQQQWF